jgi:hypothetical protein
MTQTRLFTTAYPEENERRRSEYKQCLELNLANESIDEICILCEGDDEWLPKNEKIKIRRIFNRPSYQNYFDWISELTTGADISIIANSDIYFDQQLSLFSYWKIPSECVLVLARWDVTQSDKPTLVDRNDSQDAWVFKGPLRNVQADFPVGIPRCDNRFLHELKKAGYEVINPAFSVRAYHLHAGTRPEYQNENLEHFVEPPYAYLWPHNLWSLPRTVLHNLRHPDARLFWRLDRRKISSSLPVRTVRKVLRSFKLARGSAD